MIVFIEKSVYMYIAIFKKPCIAVKVLLTFTMHACMVAIIAEH